VATELAAERAQLIQSFSLLHGAALQARLSRFLGAQRAADQARDMEVAGKPYVMEVADGFLLISGTSRRDPSIAGAVLMDDAFDVYGAAVVRKAAGAHRLEVTAYVLDAPYSGARYYVAYLKRWSKAKGLPIRAVKIPEPHLGRVATPAKAGRLRTLLATNHYGGYLDANTIFTRLGVVRTPQAVYQVYDVENIGRHSYSKAVHDTQMLVILRDNREYVGAYSIDNRPVAVKGRDILFDVPDLFPHPTTSRLHIDEDGPPKKAFFDNEVHELAR
jgi:hypothetical protein